MVITCDKQEAMRYLGYRCQEISDDMSALIESVAEEAQSLAKFFYCSTQFKLLFKKDVVCAADYDLELKGKDIKKHLKGCKSAIIFGATLGVEIERKIQMYEQNDLTRAVVLDCCASAMIESFCDKICDGFSKKIIKEGEYVTSRYSPGYGDFPLSEQKEILRVLNAQRKAGITCNEQFLLFPRKSVTAVVGISEKKPAECAGSKCDLCSMKDTCPLRRS